jgi:pimeloyl-ACP methyl ester carboxylesterase
MPYQLRDHYGQARGHRHYGEDQADRHSTLESLIRATWPDFAVAVAKPPQGGSRASCLPFGTRIGHHLRAAAVASGTVIRHSQGMGLARRIAAVAAAGVASFLYQRLAEARDRRRFPPPGRLVDIGGRRLHLVTAGVGLPAVVIIPALGENVLGWLHIVRDVAVETQICVYDRAEIGWSEPPAHGRRTPDAIAADLHALLCADAIPGPYVLVGHSYGGIIARRFYAQHPEMVAGMLLVDSSHERQARRFAAADWRRGPALYAWVAVRRQARILGMRRLAASLGLVRGFDADIAREVPVEYAGAYRAILLSSRHRRAVVREILMAAHTWGQPPGLGSIPLTVLTRATGTGDSWPVWALLQDELATLSSSSEHIHAETAGHYIQLDEPDLVVGAIRDLVRRCR